VERFARARGGIAPPLAATAGRAAARSAEAADAALAFAAAVVPAARRPAALAAAARRARGPAAALGVVGTRAQHAGARIHHRLPPIVGTAAGKPHDEQRREHVARGERAHDSSGNEDVPSIMADRRIGVNAPCTAGDVGRNP
jgi:hypothetical protein